MMYRHMPGWNVLPRHNLDMALVEAHYAALAQPPGVTVVSHEPPALERLMNARTDERERRKRGEPLRGLYIYRDSPPGHGTDDDVYEKALDAREYVRYLHAKAPADAALYLGNEPNHHAAAASWTMIALQECDVLNRVGVCLNLFPGHPEKEAWSSIFLPLLRRIGGTRHVLGLHEYAFIDGLDVGWLIGRCAWVGEICQQFNVPTVQIAITELGICARRGDGKLDPGRGYRLVTDEAGYAGWLDKAWGVIEAIPNVVGAAIYCMGQWGENGSFDCQHASKVQTAAEARTTMATIVIKEPDNLDTAANVRVTLGQGDTNVRAEASTKAAIVRLVKRGEAMTYYPATRLLVGALAWFWVEMPDGTRGWMAQWHDDEREQFVPVVTQPPPAPPPPPPEPQRREVRISIEVSGMPSDDAWKLRAALMDMLLKMAALVQALPGGVVFAVDDGQ